MENIREHSSYWKDYWSKKTCGGHRSSEEEFLYKEAKEKLFHLSGGKSLLDFGCGSADLLKYYIPHYSTVIGSDFSQSMLNAAKQKIQESFNDEYSIEDNINCRSQSQDIKTVYLLLADDKTIWQKLPFSVDRITTAGVMAYLTLEQIDDFLFEASKKLNEDGKVIFFDVIDPKLYILWSIGFFSKTFSVIHLLKIIPFYFRRLGRKLKHMPKDEMGNSFNPNVIERISNKNGFKMEYIRSMYYEYRYHVILTKINAK